MKRNSRAAWNKMLEAVFGLDADAAASTFTGPPPLSDSDPRKEVFDLLDALFAASIASDTELVESVAPNEYHAEDDPEFQRLTEALDK